MLEFVADHIVLGRQYRWRLPVRTTGMTVGKCGAVPGKHMPT